MESDTILILILAVLFFGGVGYLVWTDRRKQKAQVEHPVMPIPDTPRSTENRKTKER